MATKAALKVPTLLCAIALVSGCASSPQLGPRGDQTIRQPSASAQQAAAPVVPATVSETDAQRLARLTKSLESRSVYFAYDDYSVSREQLGIVQAHAEVLRSVPAAVVTLEGNADERGSREYNLALGQKRAEAVARMLGVNGITGASLETVSFGEEKARAACHEERCWADNRRVDFRYWLPKKR